MNEFMTCVQNKYWCFEGRASRKEYWMYTLVYSLIFAAVFAVELILMGVTHQKWLSLISTVFGFAFLGPSLGVTVRRYHDTDRSGWWTLIGLVPFIGGIVALVFLCMGSTPGDNKYGSNPYGPLTTSPIS